jgi:hypothetical protein
MKSFNPSFIATLLILGVAFITSCTKDTDGENWSPTQALPPDTTSNNNNNNPIDTGGILSYPFNLQAILIGDQSFLGDSTTYQYTYDTLATMHEFSCIDVNGRQLILRLPDLDLGDHPISFATTTTITLIDGTVVFDTGFNPNGYINIYSNSNGRISALFESDMTDIGGTGQIKELVNGLMENAPYE